MICSLAFGVFSFQFNVFETEILLLVKSDPCRSIYLCSWTVYKVWMWKYSDWSFRRQKLDVGTTKQRGQSLFLSSYKVRAVILDQYLQEKLAGWPIYSFSYETYSIVLWLNNRTHREVGCLLKRVGVYAWPLVVSSCKEVAGLKCEPCFARRLSYVLLVDWTLDASSHILLM